MTPIWKKSKNEIKEEDYNDFYFSRYYDYNKPLKTIHYKVEGITSYTALLYIPSKAPYNYYTNDYKVGLSLYSKGVFIKDEASELISDCFRFVQADEYIFLSFLHLPQHQSHRQSNLLDVRS